jgi:predicted NUDIX family phosphoesterase
MTMISATKAVPKFDYKLTEGYKALQRELEDDVDENAEYMKHLDSIGRINSKPEKR